MIRVKSKKLNRKMSMLKKTIIKWKTISMMEKLLSKVSITTKNSWEVMTMKMNQSSKMMTKLKCRSRL